MAQSKFGNFVKILGFLTVIGTVLSKLMPLFSEEHPQLKKKVSKIGDLLMELKDEVAHLTTTSTTKKSKKK